MRQVRSRASEALWVDGEIACCCWNIALHQRHWTPALWSPRALPPKRVYHYCG